MGLHGLYSACWGEIVLMNGRLPVDLFLVLQLNLKRIFVWIFLIDAIG